MVDKEGRFVDLATLLGLIGGFGIVFAAMASGGSILLFVNVPSLLIVLGGSIFVALMKFNGKQFLSAMKVAAKAFLIKSDKPEVLIAACTEMATAARKGGLLSLEAMEMPNEFMGKGIQYVVDGLDVEVVRATLKKDMIQAVERHIQGQQIFKALGDVAPAMGMIGTLVGLVQMLSAMDDPQSIGPAMAVALLTTLYGAMIATMFALPIADKLGLRSKEESQNKSLMIDAILGIQAGQNPRLLEELLKTYLSGNQRDIEVEAKAAEE